MINNSIGKKSDLGDKKPVQNQKKPNENSGVYLSSHIKIYDPNTNAVYVQKRADE